MQFGNWIYDSNLIAVSVLISDLCRYNFTEMDKDAIEYGASYRADETKGEWFEYTFCGDFEVKIRITKESGSSIYSFQVNCEKDILRELSTIFNIAQGYELRGLNGSY